ncbi:MAG TPA: protease modulator HflK [Roseimicrobium sp.]|nr:protease modulator HflK [Roseimicrobium sp.]
MNSDRNIQRNGLVNLVVLLASAIASLLLARYVRTTAGEISAVFLGFGTFIAAISYFQMRLEAREVIEKLEYDELIKAKSSATLFESAEAEGFPAQRAREQFERIFIPAFTTLIFIFQALAVWWLWRRYTKVDGIVVENTTIGMVFFGIAFVVLLLLGKYSAGIARLENQRLLRPGSAYMMLGAVLASVVTATQAAAYFGFPGVDLIVAKIGAIVLGLTALETLLHLVFEIYRPRVKGQQNRLLYESRVIGLLGQPGGLITTAAQALDYQFGFKVSETWFYRFLERAFAWIVLGQLLILSLSTTFFFVEPHEQGLLERMGNPVAGEPLKPGLHFKLPWPVDKVYRYRTEEIQQFVVGVVPDHDKDKEKTLLWTRAHYKEEFNLLVASRGQNSSNVSTNDQTVPVNLLTVSIPVQYRINNVKDWAYEHGNAAELLERIATREVVSYLVSVDIDDIMAAGRFNAAAALTERIQKQADVHKLGVKIIFVGLQDIHPPVNIADAYEAVNGALQMREGIILSAEGYQAQALPYARSEATKRVTDAQAYQFRKVAESAATAGRFANQVKAYNASPEVFRQRTHLQAVARAVAPARKYFLGTTNTHDVLMIDLQDKIRADLLDAGLPETKN